MLFNKKAEEELIEQPRRSRQAPIDHHLRHRVEPAASAHAQE